MRTTSRKRIELAAIVAMGVLLLVVAIVGMASFSAPDKRDDDPFAHMNDESENYVNCHYLNTDSIIGDEHKLFAFCHRENNIIVNSSFIWNDSPTEEQLGLYVGTYDVYQEGNIVCSFSVDSIDEDIDVYIDCASNEVQVEKQSQ